MELVDGDWNDAAEMFEGLNSEWISSGVQGTERLEGTTPARDVFVAAQEAVKA